MAVSKKKKKWSFDISFTFWSPYFLIGSILNVFHWTERIMEAEVKRFGSNQDFFFFCPEPAGYIGHRVVSSGGERRTEDDDPVGRSWKWKRMMDRRKGWNLVRLVLTGREWGQGCYLGTARVKLSRVGKDIQGDSSGRLTRKVSHCAIGWQEMMKDRIGG